ncbi:hypothetical protein Pst134EA_021224 [Puccinia striiformis f. sp. tritici]|uniref:hypothetical protein n=1 Tax=Puccinia striiformis f. sp. tritici TaxID=168172 RepID=UPI002007A655|nr:hypothetical protein Pst134EA_021224 [Puccinia striiformis f. sp. tritici]KAH9457341.1 hypothetical protein Pst134EA_021224 [Puccinia striiformis f. sp. tritici]
MSSDWWSKSLGYRIDTQKKKGTGNDQSASIDGEDALGEEDNPDSQIQMYVTEPPLVHRHGITRLPFWVCMNARLLLDDDAILLHDGDLCEVDSIDQDDVDDLESLNKSDIENGSNEDEGDCYTSDSCKQTLAKFRRIAKKLRYSPNSKAKFIEICLENGCEPATLEWQQLKRYRIDRKYYVDKANFALARDLADVLNHFYEVTLQILIASSARLADIVVFIDQITKHLLTTITNTNYPPALRNAC